VYKLLQPLTTTDTKNSKLYIMKTMHLSFQLKKKHQNEARHYVIYARITVGGQRSEFSIKKYWDPKKWEKPGFAKGNSEAAKTLNCHLSLIRSQLDKIHSRLVANEPVISAELIKTAYLCKGQAQRAIVGVFESHNDRMKKLIGIEYSEATYTKYCTTLSHLKGYLRSLSKVDVVLQNLDRAFIQGFADYLRINNCSHNNHKR
jgi:hypothetical protein